MICPLKDGDPKGDLEQMRKDALGKSCDLPELSNLPIGVFACSDCSHLKPESVSSALRLDLLGESGSADRLISARLMGRPEDDLNIKRSLEPGLSGAMNPGSMRFTGEITRIPSIFQHIYHQEMGQPWRP